MFNVHPFTYHLMYLCIKNTLYETDIPSKKKEEKGMNIVAGTS